MRYDIKYLFGTIGFLCMLYASFIFGKMNEIRNLHEKTMSCMGSLTDSQKKLVDLVSEIHERYEIPMDQYISYNSISDYLTARINECVDETK